MKLVCIDDATDALKFGSGERELTWGKSYEIVAVYKTTDGRLYFSLVNDCGNNSDYLSTRFITGEEFRSNQLEKLGL